MLFREMAGDAECWATAGEQRGLRTARGTSGTSLPASHRVQLARDSLYVVYPPSCHLAPHWGPSPPLSHAASHPTFNHRHPRLKRANLTSGLHAPLHTHTPPPPLETSAPPPGHGHPSSGHLYPLCLVYLSPQHLPPATALCRSPIYLFILCSVLLYLWVHSNSLPCPLSGRTFYLAAGSGGHIHWAAEQ